MAVRLIDFARRFSSPLAVTILTVLVLVLASSIANAAFFNLLRAHMMRADLQLGSFTLDRTEVTVGETIQATVTISNAGATAATSTLLTFWAASGSTSTMSTATRLAAVPLGTLSPNASLTHVSTLQVPDPAATYRIFASVQTSTYELNRENNTGSTTLNVLAEDPPASSPSSPSSPPPAVDESAPPPVVDGSACDYFASPSGTGDGFSAASPFKIQNFWALAQPGKTLCLLDGIYQGPDNMIEPPPGLSGTATSRITIRALNDGQTVLDGQFARNTISLLNNNDYWVLEGFNVKNGDRDVIVVRGGSDFVTVRRVVAWDADIRKNTTIIRYMDSQGGLFEDVGVFGTAAISILYQHGGGSNPMSLTLRRVWCRWEGSTTNIAGKECVNTAYGNAPNLIAENLLVTSSNESMPALFTITDAVGNAVTTSNPNCPGMGTQTKVPCPEAPIRHRTAFTDFTFNSQLLGSLVYLSATDQWGNTGDSPAGIDLIRVPGPTGNDASGFHIRHTMAFIHPSNARASELRGFVLTTKTSGSTADDIIAANITSVGQVSDAFQPRWADDVGSSRSVGTSLGAVADPWTTTGAGANLCKRWVDGTVTKDPLWPWPMNDRIKAATASAGAYAGPCLTCVGGRATRADTDVTATVESLLGPIPSLCRSS